MEIKITPSIIGALIISTANSQNFGLRYSNVTTNVTIMNQAKSYIYNYHSRTFSIHLDGNQFVVLNANGTVIESVTTDPDTYSRDFEELKTKHILNYGNIY